jgi:hypothetical protein
MKRFFKALGWATLILIGVALVASIAILWGAQFFAEPGTAVVSLGDTEIAMHGLFDQPVLTILTAWLAVAGALFVSVIAVIFAFAISALAIVFALGITAISLLGVAVLLASPLLAVALIVWLVMRSSKRSTPPNDGATPPAVTA